MKENPNQKKALALFISGKTPKEIAETLSVPVDTVYKWQQRGDWQNHLEKIQPGNALKFITDLLDKEIEKQPERAQEIMTYKLVAISALLNPAELIKVRIANSLKQIEKVLKDNLI